MTYTVRHPPFGIAVLVSNDEGQTWSEPMALISDAPTADVGLSQTLELEPHRFLTFYYQDDQASENRKAEIIGVFWDLKLGVADLLVWDTLRDRAETRSL